MMVVIDETCALAPEVMFFLPQRLKPIYSRVFKLHR